MDQVEFVVVERRVKNMLACARYLVNRAAVVVPEFHVVDIYDTGSQVARAAVVVKPAIDYTYTVEDTNPIMSVEVDLCRC